MKRLPIRGRRRILDPEKKSKLCELVAAGASVEEAAETLDASLRTVQRERRLDENFDHELRLALQAPPDPLKMMEQAARTHWRAAAWLLERTDPERYARRPVNSANPRQVECSIRFVLEAALEATPPERRETVYRHVQAACERAFACCFPNYSPWGDPRWPQLPPTPLADQRLLADYEAPRSRRPDDCDERRAVDAVRMLPDAARAAAVPLQLGAAPSTFPASGSAGEAAAAPAPPTATAWYATLRRSRELQAVAPPRRLRSASLKRILSPKTSATTKCPSANELDAT